MYVYVHIHIYGNYNTLLYLKFSYTCYIATVIFTVNNYFRFSIINMIVFCREMNV